MHICADEQRASLNDWTKCRSAEKQSAITPVSLPNARQSAARRLSGSTQTSSAVEMYQLADELSYITGVAGVCFAITLVVSSSP